MFFSVKVPMKIGGKEFHTCICYPLTDTFKATVEELEKKGKAVIYSERKFFCNGKLVEKSKKSKKPDVKIKETKKEELKEEPNVELDETKGF